MGKFIHIKSKKFPILPGEESEIINDGMYGKALAEYLQSNLSELGYEVPFVCAEDWGWWIELSNASFRFGVCIHSAREFGESEQFVCTDSILKSQKWSWSKFRFIDTTPAAEKLHKDLMKIFQVDAEVEILGVSDDLPF